MPQAVFDPRRHRHLLPARFLDGAAEQLYQLAMLFRAAATFTGDARWSEAAQRCDDAATLLCERRARPDDERELDRDGRLRAAQQMLADIDAELLGPSDPRKG